MNLTKLQKVVYKAYLEDSRVVDDDALLQATVWARYWDGRKSLYENLKICPRAESLSRRRRELYNMGLITYSDHKLKERTEAFKNERDMHSDSWFTAWANETTGQLDKLTIRTR